jgi:minor histocompatibility antigen H13
MLTFSAAQPALLYLVPACIGAPLFLAVIKGDFSPLWAYEDYPPKKKTKPTSGDADGDAPSGDQVAVQPSTPPHDQ